MNYKRVSLILLIVNIIWFSKYINDRLKHEMKNSAVDSGSGNFLHYYKGRDIPFNRKELVQDVAKGDKDAAFSLARHYGNIGINEAAWFWFAKAHELGHKGVSQEVVDAVKESIINAELDP
jgi:hypothetical protein